MGTGQPVFPGVANCMWALAQVCPGVATSYTWAYLGLCPHSICWCPGENNVESYGQKSVISNYNSHVNVK